MPSLAHLAIEAALKGDWAQASKINEELLKNDPRNTETLNRLAQAALGLGKIVKAKRLYSFVLNQDKSNPIAQKNLERINCIKHPANQNPLPHANYIKAFLEEPGKTKIIDLVNLATPEALSTTQVGREAVITIRKHGIAIYDVNGNYLGALPDDVGRRLQTFMKGGCEYEAFVKTATKNSLSVFIKERKKTLRFQNQPSFLCNHLLSGSVKESKEILEDKTPPQSEFPSESEEE